MKKILIPFMALVSLFIVTSCSNDDIAIDYLGNKYSLTMTVNSQSMYDTFDLTYSIREQYLRDGGKNIGIFTFIYDSEGNLAAEKKTYLSNFNSANVNFPDLVEDTYTVITVETLIDPNDNYESDKWSIENIDRLSTIKIKNEGKTAQAPAVLGIDTQLVDLFSNKIINIIPKAIGSLIKFQQYNWENSEFVNVGWGTRDVLSYYSLNPDLSANDRYVTELNTDNSVYPQMKINVDDNGSYYAIYVLQPEITWLIIYQDAEQVSDGMLYIGSNNIAKLENGETYQIASYYNNIEGGYYKYWGSPDGLSDWKTEIEKILESLPIPGDTPGSGDTSDIFATPYTNWSNGTVAAVKSYMSGFDLYQDVTYDDIYEEYSMIYFDTNVTLYNYLFKTKTDGLTDVIVFMSDKAKFLSEVQQEIERQGYKYNSKNGNNYYYTSPSTYVTIYVTDSGSLMINYYDPKAYGLAPKKMAPGFSKDAEISTIERLEKAGAECSLKAPFEFKSATLTNSAVINDDNRNYLKVK